MPLSKIESAGLGAGTVLQVVQGLNGTNTTTSGTTAIATGLTVSITPKFSTSKILITYNAPIYNTASGNQGFIYIVRNGTALSPSGYNRFGDVYSSSGAIVTMSSGSYLDSPATTSATTYAIYFASGTGSVTFGDSGVNQVITVTEIAG